MKNADGRASGTSPGWLTGMMAAIGGGTLLGTVPVEALAEGLQAPPNIVFILTDDQGYGDMSRHGHPLLETPHFDRLYDEGVRFDHFYVSPSCAPTRAALMTGMHEFRNGVTHTIIPRESLHLDAVTLPELLRRAGYASALIGKWHLGNRPGYSPLNRGFDAFVTAQGGGQIHWNPILNRNHRPDREPSDGFREDLFFDEAIKFIAAHRDQPFFCMIATRSPHTPLDAPEEFIAPFRGKVSEDEALYLGMVANIDWNIGRLLNYLDDEELANNTIVIAMNDNGATVGVNIHNAGMRGAKSTAWQGGYRALSLWRWPSRWSPATVEELTAHLDFLPTLCDYAGVEIPDVLRPKLEGFSLRPLLEQAPDAEWPEDRTLFHHTGRWPSGMAEAHKYSSASVIQGDYLLIRSHSCGEDECLQYNSPCGGIRRVEEGAAAHFHWAVTGRDQWELFNLREDPACVRNLTDGYPERAQRMIEAYESWWEDMYSDMVAAGGDAGIPWRQGVSLHAFYEIMQAVDEAP